MPEDRKYGAAFLVEGVNLGDGDRARCWIRIKGSKVEVRRYHARRVWRLDLAEAVGLIARAAQLRAIQGGAR